MENVLADGQCLEVDRVTAVTAAHDAANFTCGNTELDGWLKNRAFSVHESGASYVFVTTNPDDRVYGCFDLAAGAVAQKEATGVLVQIGSAHRLELLEQNELIAGDDQTEEPEGVVRWTSF